MTDDEWRTDYYFMAILVLCLIAFFVPVGYAWWLVA